jgi:hypothetical protein
VLQVTEPWDSPRYLSTYLLALAGCAATAVVRPERAWRWGIIVIFAQLPVLLAHSGAGPLLAAGVLFLVGQSLPAVALSLAVGALRKRIRPKG